MEKLDWSMSLRLAFGFGALLVILLIQIAAERLDFLSILSLSAFVLCAILVFKAQQMRERLLLETAEKARANENERMQERLRFTEELQSKNLQLANAHKRKDEFLAMLVHELRNPLGAMLNASESMAPLLEPLSEAEALLGIIRRQTERITRLVEDIFDVSRIAQGKIELRLEHANYAKIVERAVETCRPILNAKKHRLALHLPAKSLWLHADPARIEQVIINLLNNAARYTAPGGDITLTLQDKERQALLEIQDTGCGIPPEALPHIFDLYTQLDQPPSENTKGLGIGLALVRKLVEGHLGSIRAHSDGIGKGSTFQVFLPLLALDDAQPHIQGRKILVVDDNTDAAVSMARVLSHWKYEVQVAHDGMAAMKLLKDFQPQAVLLDLSLPGDMDGYRVAKEIRQSYSSRIFLAALTGQSSEQAQPDYASMFDAYFVKPAKLDHIKQTLLEALQ